MAELDSAGTLSVALFRALTELLDQSGVATGPILAACGLDRRLFHLPLYRISATVEHVFWDEVEQATGDLAIGLQLGSRFARGGRLSVELYLALHSATPRGALRCADRFCRIGDDRGHLDLREDGALATVRIHRDGGHPRAASYLDGLVASITTLLTDRVPGFALRRVQLRRARPASIQPYVDTLGIVPEFGARHVELSFDSSLLDVPMRGSDSVLGEILLTQVQQLWEQTPAFDPLLARIQQTLTHSLARGHTTLPTVARDLGTSARTLRRRLASMGTSFQAVLDGMRGELARHHLRHGDDSIASVAERLGFASSSAFHRAFLRWYGVAPSSFRAEMRGPRSHSPL